MALVVNKGALVVDCCELGSRSHVWSLTFVWDAFVHDITLVSFLSKLNGIAIHDSPHNSIKWNHNSNGIFFVKSFYMKLVSLASSPFYSFLEDPSKITWKSVAPLKTLF